MENKAQQKVFVGLSGGVDSAVSAYLLLQQGYDVHGVFIQTWTPEWMECGWRDDRRDAMRVAIHLGIPFHDLDLSDEYKRGVADYMIAEYRAGRTPNPDVMCNREVKFGGFLRYALAQGADYVATGHYSQNIHGQLHKGVDPAKDQSYFLWTLAQEQLSHVLFPVGGLPKSQTRTIAQQAGLPVAAKRDSQGICFLGQVDMEEFLSHYIEHREGDVLNSDGEVIGKHTGVWFVTIGQRFGGIIADTRYQGQQLFVVGKDVEGNTITVAPDSSGSHLPLTPSSQEEGAECFATQSQAAVLEQTVLRAPVTTGDSFSAQIRYHGEEYSVSIRSYNSDTQTLEIQFQNKIAPLVASGQSVVLYNGAVCVGGGIAA